MKDRRGYSLIELVMMIGLAAIIFSGSSKAYQTLTKRALDSRDYLIALNLARWQMAKINVDSYPALVGSETALSADAAFPNYIPTWQVASVATSGSNSIRQITVRIRKNSASGPVLIRLDTYRTDLATFGNGT